jgi:hypothetical protein
MGQKAARSFPGGAGGAGPSLDSAGFVCHNERRFSPSNIRIYNNL